LAAISCQDVLFFKNQLMRKKNFNSCNHHVWKCETMD